MRHLHEQKHCNKNMDYSQQKRNISYGNALKKNIYTLVYRLESVNFGHAEVVTWISYVQSRARIGNHSNL